jgi:hypothetical protein
MSPLHGVADHRLDRLGHFGVGDRLDQVSFGAEQEMHRHHAGLRRQRRRVGRRGNAEFDVACLHQLQHLRFLPELRAGILVDQHGALAQGFQFVSENVAEDSIARRLWLVVGEAIMLHLLRTGACRHHERACRDCRSEAVSQAVHRLPLDIRCFLSSSHRGRLNVNRTSGVRR